MLADYQNKIQEVLKEYWGYESFRPFQQEIILSVLSKKDTLALLPTGGGKSLCFQVPGLVLEGITLVVSPLIALMNDQVANLKKKGISAVAISSAMNKVQINNALSNALAGHVKFLYVSPERLQGEVFRKQLSQLPISLIAVDEAHCISQWGYDFRPSYLKIADLRNYFKNVNIIALTASATEEVVEDIKQKLGLSNTVFFRQSFYRKNLRYIVQLEENKTERLLKLVHNIGGSGVLYLRNRRKSEQLASFLIEKGISAEAYHAGMNYEKRQTVQKNWIENKTQIICATNAFGMGIDKPDVRFVVHLDLPDSPEAYFQEAGRAGRDGKTAFAVLFFNKRDEERLLDNFKYAYPELEQIKNTYRAIGNYYQIAIGSGEGVALDFDLDLLCKSYGLHPIIVYNSIRFLEKENYLSLLDVGYEPSKLMIVCGREYLYEYQLKNPRMEPLIKVILRTYGGVFEDYVSINESELMYKAKISMPELQNQLKLLHDFDIISYLPKTSLPKLLYTQSRVHEKEIIFDKKNYDFLKDNHRKRMESVIKYANNNKVCRQIQLLTYFNETNAASCGYCDVCISNKSKDTIPIKKLILQNLKKESLSLNELKQKMKLYNEETWISSFNELVDDGIIVEKKGKFFCA